MGSRKDINFKFGTGKKKGTLTKKKKKYPQNFTKVKS